MSIEKIGSPAIRGSRYEGDISMTAIVCVGTSAHGLWFSKDLGETWERPTSRSGLYLEAGIFALATHPSTPNSVLAGTDHGIYRWSFSAERWTHLPSPMDGSGQSIWSLIQATHDPKVLLAGTRPAGFFRSDDGGASWRKVLTPIADDASNATRADRGYSSNRYMRVTRMLFDPTNTETIWAGIEIDAIHRSEDGGKNWTRISEGLVSDDIHDLAIFDYAGKRTMFATTNKGLHRSEDGGRSWKFISLSSPWQYTRTITERADKTGVVFLTNGNGPPGSTGRLLRSRNYGESWEDAELPGVINSTPWCVATHPANPQLLFACSNLGQLFRSDDGGETWRRLTRELGDVRSMCWLPG